MKTVNLTIEERIKRCEELKGKIDGFNMIPDTGKYANLKEKKYFETLAEEKQKLIDELNVHHKVLQIAQYHDIKSTAI